MYTYKCMHICSYSFTCICVLHDIYLCAYVCLFAHLYKCPSVCLMQLHACMHSCISVSVCMYVRHVCLSVCLSECWYVFRRGVPAAAGEQPIRGKLAPLLCVTGRSGHKSCRGRSRGRSRVWLHPLPLGTAGVLPRLHRGDCTPRLLPWTPGWDSEARAGLRNHFTYSAGDSSFRNGPVELKKSF